MKRVPRCQGRLPAPKGQPGRQCVLESGHDKPHTLEPDGKHYVPSAQWLLVREVKP